MPVFAALLTEANPHVVAQSVDLLVKLARQSAGSDRAYLEAICLGRPHKEAEVYVAIAREMGGAPAARSDAFAWIAWRLRAAAALDGFKARVLSDALSVPKCKLMLAAPALVPSREAAGAVLEVAPTKGALMADLAQWWLMNRKDNAWKPHGVESAMKARGNYDPDNVKLVVVEMPAPAPEAPKLSSVAEIAAFKGDPSRERAAVAVCYSCHRIGKDGVDFGPDLST